MKKKAYRLRRNYNSRNNGLPKFLPNGMDSSVEQCYGEICLIKSTKGNLFDSIWWTAPERLSKHPYNINKRKKAPLLELAKELNLLVDMDTYDVPANEMIED